MERAPEEYDHGEVVYQLHPKTEKENVAGI